MMKVRKTMMGFAMAVGLILALPMMARAEGTTTIHLSGKELSVGDTLSVQVVATEAGTLNVTYNADVLQLTGGNTAYTENGNTVSFEGTNATLTFTANKEGDSSVIVAGSNVTGSSTSIHVSGNQTAANTEETNENNTQSGDTSSVEGQFVIDGVGYVASERFSEDEIPAGFERTRVRIQSYDYKALTNGTITLVYLKPASDTSGKGVFYVYDAEKNEVSTFALLGDVLLEKPESLLLKQMTETEITVEGRTLKVYSLPEQTEFCFAYGTDAQGFTGWFQYDTTDGSVQRVNEALLPSDTTETEEVTVTPDNEYYKKWERQRYLLAALLFAVVALVVVVINLLLAKRRGEDDYDDAFDEDEYDDAYGAQAEAETQAEKARFTQDALLQTTEEKAQEETVTETTAMEERLLAEAVAKISGEAWQEAEDMPKADEADGAEDVPEADETDGAEDVPEADETDATEDMPGSEDEADTTEEENEAEEHYEFRGYHNMKRTQAFRSSKEMHYKSDIKNQQIEIVDLNDL